MKYINRFMKRSYMKTLTYLIILSFSFCFKIQYEEKNKDQINSEDLGASQCLATDEEIKIFLDDHNMTYSQQYDRNLRFILSPCSPIVLVPGIYSTKLKVKINCKNLKRTEKDMYEKVRLYCSEFVCTSDSDTDENRDLWFNLGKKGFTLFYNFIEPNKNSNSSDENIINNNLKEENFKGREDWDLDNRHSACLGFFMTIFDNKDECPTIQGKRGEKRICGHSQNIKISYEGGFYNDKRDSDCGVKAVENILYTNWFLDLAARKKTNVFGDFVEKLTDIGYEKGFSLAAVPNDYRKFISTNEFANKALTYHIERMYKLTGKPVVIIAHSFGNLITLNALNQNKNLTNKIKKWISLAPPFAGATKAIKYFLHGIKDFNNDFTIFKTEFKLFGQYMMLKSIPTVYELKPFNIFSELFDSEEYKDFGDAIRERIKLEKLCKSKQCTPQEISENSKQFNKYFINYFPNMDMDQCKYESSIGGNSKALNRKCMVDIFNVVDCPSIVLVENNNNLGLNIEDYCDRSKVVKEERYFPEKCDSSKNYKCLDDLLQKVPNVFERGEVDYFINRFNNLFSKELNKKIDKSYFDNSEEIKLTIEKMIEYQRNISNIKNLEIPDVDIDIVYSSFNPTLSSEFLKKENLSISGGEVTDGGDGTVPTWSPLLTAFKWIYEKEKNNLKQNIRLVQYCSRLAKENLGLTNFKAISCQCLDENNVYKTNLDACGHQDMLVDENLYSYIYDEINIDNITKYDSSIINAIIEYKIENDYLQQCNHQLLVYSSPKSKIQCDDYEITKENYDSKNYCDNQNYATKEGFKCCSVHVKGNNNLGEFFDEYFCRHMKSDKDYQKFMKEFIISNYEFYEDYGNLNVEFKCFSYYIKTFIYLVIILNLLL